MKKHTVVLTCIAIVVVVFSMLYGKVEKDQNKIFEEEVEFGAFYNSYNEPFTISEDTSLEITLKADIGAGEVTLKIYNDEKEIYNVSGGHLDEHVNLDITKGKWYYLFECCNGERNVEAENGSYSVKIIKS